MNMEEDFTLYENEKAEEKDPRIIPLFSKDEIELTTIDGKTEPLFKLVDEVYPFFKDIPPCQREATLYYLCPDLSDDIADFILDCFATKERMKIHNLTQEEIDQEIKEERLYTQSLQDENFPY